MFVLELTFSCRNRHPLSCVFFPWFTLPVVLSVNLGGRRDGTVFGPERNTATETSRPPPPPSQSRHENLYRDGFTFPSRGLRALLPSASSEEKRKKEKKKVNSKEAFYSDAFRETSAQQVASDVTKVAQVFMDFSWAV